MDIFAADLKAFESVGSTVLTVVAVGVSIVSLWLSRRSAQQKRDEEAQKKEAEQLATAARQYTDQQCQALTAVVQQIKQSLEFAVQTQKREAEQLAEAVDGIEKGCVRHQSTGYGDAIIVLRRDVDKVLSGLERTATDMQRYITTDSYRHDLKLWTNSFTTMRQSIHDLAMLVKGLLDVNRE